MEDYKAHSEESRSEEDEFDCLEDSENMDAEWYQESDTGDDIPDPNMQKEALFQKPDTLPVELPKDHFEEGLLYFMVFDNDHDSPLMVMIIETGIVAFLYRVFYVRGSSTKTWHEAGTNKSINMKMCGDMRRGKSW